MIKTAASLTCLNRTLSVTSPAVDGVRYSKTTVGRLQHSQERVLTTRADASLV